MVAGGMSEGLVSAEEICARLEAALASGRADEDWERMVPPEGSIDYLLCYQPRLKRLLRN
jgi:hypothetical protein